MIRLELARDLIEMRALQRRARDEASKQPRYPLRTICAEYGVIGLDTGGAVSLACCAGASSRFHCGGPRGRERVMPEPLEQPLGVGALDEFCDDLPPEPAT
jgi:hypothetical protein